MTRCLVITEDGQPATGLLSRDEVEAGIELDEETDPGGGPSD